MYSIAYFYVVQCYSWTFSMLYEKLYFIHTWCHSKFLHLAKGKNELCFALIMLDPSERLNKAHEAVS